jgi:hypothetical protein
MVKPGAITGRPGQTLGGAVLDPWLCFESSTEKRRLSPVPLSWEVRSDEELDVMRRAAEAVKRKE